MEKPLDHIEHGLNEATPSYFTLDRAAKMLGWDIEELKDQALEGKISIACKLIDALAIYAEVPNRRSPGTSEWWSGEDAPSDWFPVTDWFETHGISLDESGLVTGFFILNPGTLHEIFNDEPLGKISAFLPTREHRGPERDDEFPETNVRLDPAHWAVTFDLAGLVIPFKKLRVPAYCLEKMTRHIASAGNLDDASRTNVAAAAPPSRQKISSKPRPSAYQHVAPYLTNLLQNHPGSVEDYYEVCRKQSGGDDSPFEKSKSIHSDLKVKATGRGLPLKTMRNYISKINKNLSRE